MQTTIYKIRFAILFSGSLLISITGYSQQTPAQTYPKIAGYVGVVHPIVTFSSDGTHTNFKDSYVVGMPIGVNIWKSAKIGFSSEIVPFIKATSSGILLWYWLPVWHFILNKHSWKKN